MYIRIVPYCWKICGTTLYLFVLKLKRTFLNIFPLVKLHRQKCPALLNRCLK